MIDPVEFGKAMGAIVRDAMAPVLKRLDELEARQAERGEKGDAGLPGEPGRDAEPIDVADIVAELLVSPELKTLLDLQATESVAEYFEANPVQHGKDGATGEQGEPGPRGEKGLDGADGVGIAGAMINRNSELVITTTKGDTITLGVVVGADGQPGKDGRDGLSAENFEREYLPDSHEIRERWTAGDQVKELTYPAGGIRYIGYWREGAEAKGGDATTHDGTLWVAIRDTKAKPSRESSDWNIGARKGRDGLQGPAGKEYKPPEPVKLT